MTFTYMKRYIRMLDNPVYFARIRRHTTQWRKERNAYSYYNRMYRRIANRYSIKHAM